MEHPSAGTVHLGGGLGTRHRNVSYHFDKRVVTLGEIGHLGGPVVHLDVDVGGVFGVPGGILAGVGIPYALKIGRLGSRAERSL